VLVSKTKQMAIVGEDASDMSCAEFQKCEPKSA